MHEYSDRVWNALICPFCGGPLTKAGEAAVCSGCDARYGSTRSGALDFRLQQPKTYDVSFGLGRPLPTDQVTFEALRRNPAPEVDFSGVHAPFHLTNELLSYFPAAKRPDSLMLDLGCGPVLHHRAVCEHAGFDYVGLDYESDEALLLGDAHSLPFKNDVFDFILSIAVLEHIQFPFVMTKEAYRVLKPGGLLIGTVAFLEPFHGNSFYHHTHLGTLNSLNEAGFSIRQIAPSAEWAALRAQAQMALFPRMPKWLSRALVAPLQLLHRFWWGIGGLVSSKVNEAVRVRNTTGAFTFIATKE